MKLSSSIVLASGTLSLASMRDYPPQHLARFATDAIFTHIGGGQDSVPAHLDSRQEAGGSPAATNAAPAFTSSTFDAPLTFNPSMPDAGYTPPSYPPSTATEVPGSPAGPAPASPSQQQNGPPGYGGWGSPPSASPTCSTSSEVWGGQTFTQSSPPGKPTGWGWSPPAQAPPQPNSSINSSINSSMPAPAPASTWQTTTTTSPAPNVPSPAAQTPTTTANGGGFQQGPGSSPAAGPHQNNASGVPRNLAGMFLALCAVAVGAALS